MCVVEDTFSLESLQNYDRGDLQCFLECKQFVHLINRKTRIKIQEHCGKCEKAYSKVMSAVSVLRMQKMEYSAKKGSK